jgi:hypothetical protein
MTIPPLVLIVAGIAAVIFAMYRVQGASVLILAAAICAISWGAVKYDTSALPVPPGPGPNPPPTPGPGPVPPPNPTGFAANVQAAFKADNGTRQNAVMLGALSETMGEVIPIHKDLLKTSADVGTLWEKFRATRFQPLNTWAPKTHTAIVSEATNRGLIQYATLNGNRQAFADFYTELGKALLAYE